MNHSTVEMESHVVDIMMIRIFLHQKNRPYFTFIALKTKMKIMPFPMVFIIFVISIK